MGQKIFYSKIIIEVVVIAGRNPVHTHFLRETIDGISVQIKRLEFFGKVKSEAIIPGSIPGQISPEFVRISMLVFSGGRLYLEYSGDIGKPPLFLMKT